MALGAIAKLFGLAKKNGRWEDLRAGPADEALDEADLEDDVDDAFVEGLLNDYLNTVNDRTPADELRLALRAADEARTLGLQVEDGVLRNTFASAGGRRPGAAGVAAGAGVGLLAGGSPEEAEAAPIEQPMALAAGADQEEGMPRDDVDDLVDRTRRIEATDGGMRGWLFDQTFEGLQGLGMSRSAAADVARTVSGEGNSGIGLSDFVPFLGGATAVDDFRREPGIGTGIGAAMTALPVVGAAAAPGVRRAASEIAGRLEVGPAAGSLAAQSGRVGESPQARAGRGRRALNQAIPAGAERGSYAASPTVSDVSQVAFPGIYRRPDELVGAARVAPENPLMERLFGVNRDDLYEISQQGTRPGNVSERPFSAAEKPRGSRAANAVMNPRNEQRILDIIGEAQQRPDLYKGMASWYTMDPLFDQFRRLYGDDAAAEYERFNTLTGMASPGSEVLSELNRGSAANWLDKEGRFGDFMKYAGLPMSNPTRPQDMAAVISHPYHKTAQGNPMQAFLESGRLEMGSAKVPSYIRASGVPETGFQTQWPVGDAHWSRLVGLADARTNQAFGASASVPEMAALGPWWREKIAGPAGLEAVPAQAVVWGAGSNATGVTSPIAAPKLELLAQQIGKTANRLGIEPELARDMVLTGKTHAGKVDPMLAAILAAGTGGGMLAEGILSGEE